MRETHLVRGTQISFDFGTFYVPGAHKLCTVVTPRVTSWRMFGAR